MNLRLRLIIPVQRPNYLTQVDPYNDILIRLQAADGNGVQLETRLSQTTANLQAITRDLNETQKALYEEHRN